MADSKVIEGPAGYGLFKPEGAEKLPTKHYPVTDSRTKGGKGTTIEGPCDKGYPNSK